MIKNAASLDTDNSTAARALAYCTAALLLEYNYMKLTGNVL